MTRTASLLLRLARDRCGAMAIEAAFVIPVLGTLCLGGFEASRMVARNTELQTALAEAASIALAREPQTISEVNTIVNIVAVSADLDPDPEAGEVVMVRRFRCGNDPVLKDPELENSETACLPTQAVSRYLRLTLNDTYNPIWAQFGIGSPVEFSKTRMLQIS